MTCSNFAIRWPWVPVQGLSHALCHWRNRVTTVKWRCYCLQSKHSEMVHPAQATANTEEFQLICDMAKARGSWSVAFLRGCQSVAA